MVSFVFELKSRHSSDLTKSLVLNCTIYYYTYILSCIMLKWKSDMCMGYNEIQLEGITKTQELSILEEKYFLSKLKD